jgi:hypothetical protein
MKSEYFSQNALKGLERIGDILIPHNTELPSFSESRVAEGVDSLLAYAPTDDIATLNTVLGIFSFLPGSVLRWVAERMAVSHQDAGALGALFRQLNLGCAVLSSRFIMSGRSALATRERRLWM